MTHRQIPPAMRKFTRALRAGETEAERKLWRILRSRRLAGLKWRRQVPLGRYVVDFVCFERHLVAECDGSQHADNLRDQARDEWLASRGLSFWNHEILQSPRTVQDTILARAGLPV